MEFLTTEYVATQAKDEISALECSWEHHHQGETASYDDLIKAIIEEDFGIHCGLCACCELFGFEDNGRDGCKKCPLYENNQCCKGLWDELERIFSDFEDNYSETNFNKLQTVEGKLCTYIKGVLECKRAEKEKPSKCSGCLHHDKVKDVPCFDCELYKNFEPKESKPALRHGEIRLDKGGYQLFLMDEQNNGLKLCQKDGLFVGSAEQWNIITDTKLVASGNIQEYVDDLALRAEDLEGFEVSGQYDNEERKTLKSYIHNNNKSIWLYINTSSSYFDLDKATEIAHKILQEVATARRKQAQKGAT